MTGEIPPERPLKDRCEALVERMRENAETRDETEKQDALAAIEQHWAGELEALLDGEEP